VAAALPGVAIAAALVPPLCVVGYGLGTSNFTYAGGAMLLFLTNLSAIVLIGAVVFILLGIRPTREERGDVARTSIVVAILSLLLLVIPLSFATRNATRKDRVIIAIEKLLLEVSRERIQIENYAVRQAGKEYVVELTGFTFEQVDQDQVRKVQQELQQSLKLPIRIRATLVPAFIKEAGPVDNTPGTGNGKTETEALRPPGR
jgi:uncharacterized membrane protein